MTESHGDSSSRRCNIPWMSLMGLFLSLFLAGWEMIETREKYIKLTKDCQSSIWKPNVGMFIKGGLLTLDALLVMISIYWHCRGREGRSVRFEVYGTSCAAISALVGAVVMFITTDNIVCPSKTKLLLPGVVITLVVIAYDIAMYNMHMKHLEHNEDEHDKLRCSCLHGRFNVINMTLVLALLSVVAAVIYMQVKVKMNVVPSMNDCPLQKYAKCLDQSKER